MTRSALEVDVRGAVLAATVCAGVLVVVLTELLGRLDGLTLGWLVVAWGVVLAAISMLLSRLHAHRGWRLPGRPMGPRGLDLAMAVGVTMAVAATGALALLAVPITYDSMTYHLARVVHWTQNRSVDFYPTHVVRQLYMPPWAEYALLHLYLLAEGDRLANLVQWISMVVSLVGVTAIARQLGAGRRGQLLSAFVCATIPMGLLQASTTQNDYASALWLACLAWALLALETRPGLVAPLGAGASLGLALLTKGTSYVLALPLVLVFVLAGRNRTVSRKLGQGLLIGLCALALNAPHYARNLDLFGAPLGPGAEGGGGYRYANDAFWPTILASNVLRNVGLHVGTPWRAVNARIERTIDAAHAAIGIAPDDPRSTWPTTRLWITAPLAHEDVAPNGVHLVLVACALVAVWWRRGEGRLIAYAGCLVGALLLFCLFVRWQPWHSRLHLPLFVLASPLIGVVFERLKAAVLAIVLAALAASSVYLLTQNRDRPLTGRRSVFKVSWADQRGAHAGPAYVGAASFVRSTGCRDVGLALGGNDRVYFLMGLLSDGGWRGRLESVAIANVSGRLPYLAREAFEPCAIIREGSPVASGMTLGAQYYRPVWSRDEVQVLLPARLPGASGEAATGPPEVHLLMDASQFRAGDRVTIGLDAQNPRTGVEADLYVGIILPDGRSALFVGPTGLLSEPVGLAEAASFPRAMAAAPGFALSTRALLEFTFPAGGPRSTYRVFATMVKHDAPRRPGIPPEAILASDMRVIALFP